MASRTLSEGKLAELKELAHGWAKIIAEVAYGEDGPGLDVDLATMDDIAFEVGRALSAGTCEELTRRQAQQIPEVQPCPVCGGECSAEPEDDSGGHTRPLVARSGTFELAEACYFCDRCQRSFFPQRSVLRIDGHGYTAAVLEKVVLLGGEAKSFARGSQLAKKVGEFSISGMHISRLTHEIGGELAEVRDAMAQEHRFRNLPIDAGQPPVDLACIEADGGRINTRDAGVGRGVHDSGWKESKIGCLWRMTGDTFDADPHPKLPRCFTDRQRVQKLVRQLKGQAGCADDEGQPLAAEEPAKAALCDAETDSEGRQRWQPKRLFRTCVASMREIHGFGPLVAAEAQRRGFYRARRRVFLSDGDAKLRTLHKLHFPDFTAVTDFMHVVGYLYAAAMAVARTLRAGWPLFLEHAEACWQGRVDEVIAQLQAWQRQHPLPPDTKLKDVDDKDTRKIVHQTVTYLTNNRHRMKYPEYRKQGLPVTSSLIESLIKEFSLRVKGTEKFWDRGSSETTAVSKAESILQIRAALLSDDDRLSRHIRSRPGSPFVRSRKRYQATAASAS